ncbi:MAG: hypothetical protein PGN09_03535 [Sphingomonas fennica]
MSMRNLMMPAAAAAALFAVPLAAQTTAPAGDPAAAQPATGAAPAAGATAATGGKVAAGQTVKDVSGGTVGTVEAVTGEVATVNTGTNKVGVPLASFAVGPDGPVLGMTKAELDQAASGAAANAQADLASALVTGADVKGSGGASVGKVSAVEGEFVTVDTGSAKVRLPKTAFAKGPSGLMIGMSAAEFEAAAKGATASASTGN